MTPLGPGLLLLLLLLLLLPSLISFESIITSHHIASQTTRRVATTVPHPHLAGHLVVVLGVEKVEVGVGRVEATHPPVALPVQATTTTTAATTTATATTVAAAERPRARQGWGRGTC